MLYIVADLYEAVERYEDCMEILNIAYDRAPVGRMLLYKILQERRLSGACVSCCSDEVFSVSDIIVSFRE